MAALSDPCQKQTKGRNTIWDKQLKLAPRIQHCHYHQQTGTQSLQTHTTYLLDILYSYIVGRPTNVVTDMGSKGSKQRASTPSPDRKVRTPKGQSKKTIDKTQATPKKGGKRAKVPKEQELTYAAAVAFQESAGKPHEDLVESTLFQSIETADEDATTQLLAQIYADLHEASFDGLTKYTKDLKLPPSWVPDPADTSVSGWLRHSVQSRLTLHTQEMFSVIGKLLAIL